MIISLILLLTACAPEEVISLYGTLLDSPDADAIPLAGAELSVLEDQGQPYASAVTSQDGSFQVDAPGGQNIFVEVRGDGLVPASFTGIAGLGDLQEVEEGRIFGYSRAEYDQWNAAFAGCPGLEDEGSAVLGDIRLYGFIDPETGEEPIIISGYAQVTSADDTQYDACYLDDDGLAYDPERNYTGLSGRYTIAGVPAGVHTLIVGYEGAGGVTGEHEYFLWLPESGISPRFPSYVELVY
jgi:hypothetical protein